MTKTDNTLPIVMLVVGIIVGIISTVSAIPPTPTIPHCQEDEVILFNLPERNHYWCEHIDNLPALYNINPTP